MKALTCEMCGSTNLIKKDGVFVCQSCGTQYYVEEDKKMMVEGTVDVKGTVKVDTSDDELENLYLIAHRVKDSGDNEIAAKFYGMILDKDPQSWEANFYAVYFNAISCKIGEIWDAAKSLDDCIESVLQLVRTNVTDKEEQSLVIEELKLRFSFAANLLADAAKKHYDGISKLKKADFTQEYLDNASKCSSMLYFLGSMVELYFKGKYGEASAYLWKEGIKIHNQYLPYLAYREENKDIMKEYADKIRKYEADYQLPQFNRPIILIGGCYVATAVYGSYDCPQVWTLRRYRDYTLVKTWYGRAFVKTYYTISPTLVKWFGETSWFKSIGRKFLDKKVKKLNEDGVSDTKYCDKQW